MKSVRDLDVREKKVLVRVDYNLPMDNQQQITDDNRIRATLPLIEYLIDQEARVILISHMGRPRGSVVPELSLAPVARRLEEILKRPVAFVPDCIGDQVKQAVEALAPGQVLLLENLRFHDGEKDNEAGFAGQLADLCHCYINDAFAVSHRTQASVVGIPRFVRNSAAGFLLEKELDCYRSAVQSPKRPLTAVIGGAKVSGKLRALENMLQYVDTLIIGGAMANTFLKSRGISMGDSLVEEDLIETAGDIMDKAGEKGITICLPKDLVTADRFHADADTRRVTLGAVDPGWMAMDIGPETAQAFASRIASSGTVVWNGPMGVFEMPAFLEGTCTVARAVAGCQGFSVVGGGDTGLAAIICDVAARVDYISTGGGAFLHLMEGRTLPGVLALETPGEG